MIVMPTTRTGDTAPKTVSRPVLYAKVPSQRMKKKKRRSDDKKGGHEKSRPFPTSEAHRRRIGVPNTTGNALFYALRTENLIAR